MKVFWMNVNKYKSLIFIYYVLIFFWFSYKNGVIFFFIEFFKFFIYYVYCVWMYKYNLMILGDCINMINVWYLKILYLLF